MHLPRSEGYSQELSACRSRMRRRAIDSDSEGASPSTVSIIRDDRVGKRKRLGFLLLPPRIEFEVFGRQMGLAEIWVLEVGSIVILHTVAAFILVQVIQNSYPAFPSWELTALLLQPIKTPPCYTWNWLCCCAYQCGPCASHLGQPVAYLWVNALLDFSNHSRPWIHDLGPHYWRA